MEDSYVLEIRERQFSDLYMCYCGYARCRSLHSYGPAVRPNYIIHYILEGKGSYSVGGTKYELEAGQGFLIEPGALTFYQADQADPWTYLWVGFDGKRAADYLRGMGLGENRLIYRSSRGESLEMAVREMLRHNTYTAADQFVLEGLLYSFFGALSEELDVMSAREAEMGICMSERQWSLFRIISAIRSISRILRIMCVSTEAICTLFSRGNCQYRRKSIWQITA